MRRTRENEIGSGASEEHLRLAMEAAQIGIWQCDPDGKHATWSRRAREIFGLAGDEHVHLPDLRDRFHADDIEEIRRRHRAAIDPAGDGRLEMEHKVLLPDGTVRWVHVRGQTIFDGCGPTQRPDYITGIFIDVTERREIEERQRFLLELGTAIAEIDDPDSIVCAAVSRLVQRLEVTGAVFDDVDLGTNEIIVDRRYQIGWPPAEHDRYPLEMGGAALEEARAGHTVVVADASTDSRIAPLYETVYAPLGVRSFIVAPVLRAGRWLAFLAVVDRSPRRWSPADVDLVRSVADVTWPVIERTRTEADSEKLLAIAERARAEAEAANRSKDEFLSILSHELRAPLQAMSAWLELMASEPRDERTLARAIEMMRTSLAAQTGLVNDLLDVTRIVLGKFELERKRFDLFERAKEVVDGVRAAAEQKGIRLHLGLSRPVWILGDAARLSQVVSNLLSNALKFTPRGGSIYVQVRQDDTRAGLTVTDTGEGIAPSMSSRIFERFHQEDSKTTRKHGGLGLGLTIVQHVVEQHGGTVEAESEGVGRGATFRVNLPLVPAEAAPPREGLRDAFDGVLEGTRILLVEDDLVTREALALLLEDSGATVMEAGSVAEAWELFTKEPPNVVVSDIGMPGEDGYALIRKIRSAGERERRTPVIAVSGFASRKEFDSLRAAGFDDHIAKPVSPRQLIARVHDILSRL